MTRLDTDTTVHRIVGCILVSEGTEFNVEGHRRSKKRNGIRGSLPMIEVDRWRLVKLTDLHLAHASPEYRNERGFVKKKRHAF